MEFFAKTHFSFCEATSSPSELVLLAKNFDYPFLGIADVNGVYGLPKAFAQSRLLNLKLIVSSEIRFKNNRFFLIPKNKKGYFEFCKIITQVHFEKIQDGSELSFDPNDLWIGFTDFDSFEDLNHLNPSYIFSYKFDGLDHLRKKRAEDFKKKMNVICSFFPRICKPEDGKKLDVLRAIQNNIPLHKSGYINQNHHQILMQKNRFFHFFDDELIQNNLKLNEEIVFSLSDLKYRYPREWIPAGLSSMDYLKKRIKDELPFRLPKRTASLQDKLLKEVALIEELDLADFFLTIDDIVQFARSKKILCQGRGSAANSVVCFVLGITNVDPRNFDVLLERFLSRDRDEPPDIDVDFEHERREEVIQYIRSRYGEHRAAMLCAVHTYRSRSAAIDVAKAFGIETGVVKGATLLKNIEKTIERSPYLARNEIPKFIEALKKTPKHLGLHTGGFLLSDESILNFCPIQPAAMPNRSMIQWDKTDAEILKLVKVDVLSLGMLSALRKTLELTKLQLHTLPQNDPKTIRLLENADTVGTFQVESRAQMNMLGRLKPKTFYDLVIQVAIVRPGPITGQMVHPYLRRRQGKEKVSYPHPKVKNILEKTLGVPLFQEQVMRIALELGNFTPKEADHLRKSIGSTRDIDEIRILSEKLKNGLILSGISEKEAESLCNQVHGFAGYGFPESHAASFAAIAYASVYLKAHFPLEFLVSVINSQPMGFYPVHSLIEEIRRNKGKIHPLNMNESDWDFKVIEKNVYAGWRTLRSMSIKNFEVLVQNRPYVTFKDFILRSGLNSLQIQNYILSGGETFEKSQREALWKFLHIKSSQIEPNSLFDFIGDQHFVDVKPMSSETLLKNEMKSKGFSSHSHPLSLFRNQFELPRNTTKTVKNATGLLSIAGMILVRQMPRTANGVLFLTLEDEFGFLDCVVFEKILQKIKDILDTSSFVVLIGKIEKDQNTISFIVENAKALQFDFEVRSHSYY